MKLSWKKIQIYMARGKIYLTQMPRDSIRRIKAGGEVTPRVAGNIAEILGCDVIEIMEETRERSEDQG